MDPQPLVSVHLSEVSSILEGIKAQPSLRELHYLECKLLYLKNHFLSEETSLCQLIDKLILLIKGSTESERSLTPQQILVLEKGLGYLFKSLTTSQALSQSQNSLKETSESGREQLCHDLFEMIDHKMEVLHHVLNSGNFLPHQVPKGLGKKGSPHQWEKCCAQLSNLRYISLQVLKRYLEAQCPIKVELFCKNPMVEYQTFSPAKKLLTTLLSSIGPNKELSFRLGTGNSSRKREYQLIIGHPPGKFPSEISQLPQKELEKDSHGDTVSAEKFLKANKGVFHIESLTQTETKVIFAFPMPQSFLEVLQVQVSDTSLLLPLARLIGAETVHLSSLSPHKANFQGENEITYYVTQKLKVLGTFHDQIPVFSLSDLLPFPKKEALPQFSGMESRTVLPLVLAKTKARPVGLLVDGLGIRQLVIRENLSPRLDPEGLFLGSGIGDDQHTSLILDIEKVIGRLMEGLQSP